MLEYGHSIVNMLLFIVILVCILYVLRRYQSTKIGNTHAIKITSMMALGPKEKVAIMEVVGKRIIIGITASQIQTLYVEDAPHDQAN